MGAIMQCGCLAQSIEETKEGKHYQKAGYYEKALEKYEGALTLFIGTLQLYESAESANYDSPYSSAVSIEDEIFLLFVLFGFVIEIKNCYIGLNKACKSLIFQKNLEEIVTTIGKYENKLNRQQFIAYKNFSKGIESLYQEIPLAASTSREALNNLSPVTDNSDDPIFRELCSKFDECCSYRRCLLPSRGVSILIEKSSSCFIATAAYSTSTHPDIDTFRNFRDKKLLTNPFGQGLVSIYYNISPSIANYVKRHPVIKSFLRQQLERLAEWMRTREFKS